MRWKQFFTPVDSMNTNEAKQFIENNPQGDFTLLDVRQPGEYEAGHIPGSKLIPLPDLKDRAGEVDPDRPVIVYCAIGGRSRVAAQMLAGNNFSKVYNLSGGFKAWQGNAAIGPEDQGLHLFSGAEKPEEVLTIAFALEKGLREFYLMMIPTLSDEQSRNLFEKLAEIEINHQKRLFDEFIRLTNQDISMDDFDQQVDNYGMEGGLSTEDYLKLYGSDLSSVQNVIGLAMSIEAQALDLYHRAGKNAADPESRNILEQIALEEQAHLRSLGELMDQLAA